jgi:hypothetical protein
MAGTPASMIPENALCLSEMRHDKRGHALGSRNKRNVVAHPDQTAVLTPILLLDLKVYAVPGPYLFGDASRNALTGPPLYSFDWALTKNFKISERFNLQFNWQVFNAFNFTNLQNPSNTNTDTPTAGIITDIQAPMRNMQFGLHLSW